MGTVYLRDTTAPDGTYQNLGAVLTHAQLDNNMTLFLRNDVADTKEGDLTINGNLAITNTGTSSSVTLSSSGSRLLLNGQEALFGTFGGGYVIRGDGVNGLIADTEFTWSNPGAPNNTKQLTIKPTTSGGVVAGCGISIQANTTGNAYLSLNPAGGGTSRAQISSASNYDLFLQRGSNDYIALNSSGITLSSGRNLGLGGTTPSTSGAGITFPATASGSSSANTLDDYEEGTFTPSIIGSTTAGTGTYTTYYREGRYTKIGRQVFIIISIIWTAHTGTGNMNISGLPFIAQANTGYGPKYYFTVISHNVVLPANTILGAYTDGTNTVVVLNSLPIGGGAAGSIAMDTAGTIHVAGHYITSL